MTSERALPLPDYDELPITELQHRIRSLPAEDLRTLVEHEQSHANRTPVLQLLRARQQDLAEGAEPSGGDQQAGSGKPADTAHGSPVSADSAAGPGAPLRHGVADQTPARDRP